MKKILIIFLFLLFTLPVSAFNIDTRKDGSTQKHISDIGFRILNANQIPYRMYFVISKNDKVINAWTNSASRQITLTSGMYLYLQDDNELAAILAHEISHGVDSYNGILRGAFTSWNYAFRPRKYEYKADKRAIDYLVKAGYSPVAFITIMNRIAPQSRYEWYLSHPVTSKRLAEVYEYIYTKYPQYLVQNEYKDNLYYQNFLLTSRENRQKLEKKVKTKSNKKVNYL